MQANGSPIAAFRLNVPNASPVGVLPIQANAFGKATSTFTLQDGLLLSSDQELESEVALMAGVPWKALEATAKGIGELVRLRLDATTGAATATAAEADQLAAEVAKLQQYQKLLEEKRKLEQLLDAERSGP
jgi:hypothetical protein